MKREVMPARLRLIVRALLGALFFASVSFWIYVRPNYEPARAGHVESMTVEAHLAPVNQVHGCRDVLEWTGTTWRCGTTTTCAPGNTINGTASTGRLQSVGADFTGDVRIHGRLIIDGSLHLGDADAVVWGSHALTGTGTTRRLP